MLVAGLAIPARVLSVRLPALLAVLLATLLCVVAIAVLLLLFALAILFDPPGFLLSIGVCQHPGVMLGMLLEVFQRDTVT